ncbi:MAG TPA: bifunctional 5,10-methylenetetrahydrofolate dehydrogenase/5,10-methenyltetrahydrofolate cyclohydrolase [Patescibacteria group bacterium]|nr:bifunctional 5,10-methylenetetrahydrofolate dehydrogenase/5,10-methenyltetrahydrofolate cyclohydrolase [Patescibacteria group bacterium]
MENRDVRGKIIDGRSVAREVLDGLIAEVARFNEQHPPPRLTVIIAGKDPASQVYVKSKVRAAEKCGIESDLIELPPDVSRETLLGLLDRCNTDPTIDGVLVQLPLPPHIDQQEVIERIDPHKDVDGLHPFNIGRLAIGMPLFVPCTPLGISVLLARYGIDPAGAHVVIVGRSVLVGKPLALLLARKGAGGDATVSICHSRTHELAAITTTADILVAAVGCANMITAEMVKEGAVVIDVGTNRVDDPGAKRGYRLTGDVDFEAVYPRVSRITPVPGGVGPMTVAMLMQNTLQAARRRRGEDDGNEWVG